MIIAAIISFVSMGLFWSFIRKKAIKATRQIVDFYETMEDVLELGSKVNLKYSPSCEELNEL